MDSEPAAIARVRDYYKLVDSGEVSGIVELFAPDASYYRPGYSPIVGRAELLRFYAETRVIDRGEHTLSDVIADGLSVAVHGDFHGILRSGEKVVLRFADFFRLTQNLTFCRRDTFFFTPLV
ncbi:nuclear transport factor 2 family protein [Streptomyces sp. NRRL F-5123]|uniref:nuclear transport factor 2 family protein n=1 Tax=Streptomyces sp. NRRL F-5123 TaxID=1463856 RepID=UPI0004E15708|nr:nuclear transport factor 2 family protein [Streptomyces sp. NRRL F-5123]